MERKLYTTIMILIYRWKYFKYEIMIYEIILLHYFSYKKIRKIGEFSLCI